MGLIAGVGDFGLTELQDTAVSAKNTATQKATDASASATTASNKASEASTSAALAQSIAETIGDKMQVSTSKDALKAFTGFNFSYFDGSIWEKLAGDKQDNGIDNFGTVIRVNSSYYWQRRDSVLSDFSTNLFIGLFAGESNTPLSTTQGRQNTFVGANAGRNNTTGYAKSNFGYNAGYSESTANGCVNIGYQSGFNNVTGDHNTNLGTDAGARNKGSRNLFIGWHAGFGFESFATGDDNHLVGVEAAINLLNGYSNCGFGKQVFYRLTNGYNNTAFGNLAGFSLIGGHDNTLLGKEAGTNLTSGSTNILLGFRAGYYATTANDNIGIGSGCLFVLTSGYLNIAIGLNSGSLLTTGFYNTFIGANSGNAPGQKVDVAYSIAIGVEAITTKNFQAVFGSTYISETLLRGSVLINTETNIPSAVLNVESTTKGVLLPRLTTGQINNIVSPAEGLEVYNTTLHTKCFYNGSSWQKVLSAAM